MDYNPITGEKLSLTPQPWIVPELEIPQPVQYQVQPFKYTPPNYSITSDPSKTSFIPTARAKDRWLQQEQVNADNAYKGYTADFTNYQQAYKELQDKIARTTLTAAQQAEIDMNNVKTKASAEQAAYNAASDRWNMLGYVANEADAAILGVPMGTKTSDAGYREAALAKSGGGGGSSGSSVSTTAGNYQQAYQGILDDINAGYKYDDIVNRVLQSAPQLRAMGIDYANVIKYLESVYDPNIRYAEYAQANPGWEQE